MTMNAAVADRSLKYITKFYGRTPESVTLKPFFEESIRSDIKVYGTFGAYSVLCETFGTIVTGNKRIEGFITPSAIEIESIYDEPFPTRISEQSIERSEPMRESISAIKPEIVGLGLGGILSLGLGIFALATHNTGVATVMAGPFLASVLGFTLLLIGLKRKR